MGGSSAVFAPGFVVGHVGHVPLGQEQARLEIGHQAAARPLEQHPVIDVLQVNGAIRENPAWRRLDTTTP